MTKPTRTIAIALLGGAFACAGCGGGKKAAATPTDPSGATGAGSGATGGAAYGGPARPDATASPGAPK